MAEQLDPEDWAEIMNEAFGYLISPVYENANCVLNEDVDEAATVDDRLRGRWPICGRRWRFRACPRDARDRGQAGNMSEELRASFLETPEAKALLG